MPNTNVYFKEHQLQKGGSWLNWETCIQDIGEEDCPLCEGGVKSSYVCVFSIIDFSKYVSKKTGKTVTARKKLLVLKPQARNKVLKQKERRDNDLTYCLFEVTRYTEKDSATGEMKIAA